MMNVKLDCRHFSGDKPCRFHKEEGIKCPECVYCAPINNRVLIVKLGAPGDVLRTTPVLREITGRDPDVHVTWITDRASLPLLQNNSFIDRVWERSMDTVSRLLAEEFDLVLSLDNSPECATLATIARGKRKLGYGIAPAGYVVPLNAEAETWLDMAAFDDLKKANNRTYQDIIFEICGYKFNPSIHEIILNLGEEEMRRTEQFARDNGLKNSDTVVGLNIGAGARWKMKRWTVEGFVGLTERLAAPDLKVVLLGGPEEVEMAEKIKYELGRKGARIIDGGCNNSLRSFIAIVNACDVVVTGDTLAMHIAIGLGKRVAAFFGPTSASEIELYGRGAKVVSGKDCVCCYRQTCDVDPYCVELITVEEVLEAVKGCLQTSAVSYV